MQELFPVRPVTQLNPKMQNGVNRIDIRSCCVSKLLIDIAESFFHIWCLNYLWSLEEDVLDEEGGIPSAISTRLKVEWIIVAYLHLPRWYGRC